MFLPHAPSARCNVPQLADASAVEARPFKYPAPTNALLLPFGDARPTTPFSRLRYLPETTSRLTGQHTSPGGGAVHTGEHTLCNAEPDCYALGHCMHLGLGSTYPHTMQHAQRSTYARHSRHSGNSVPSTPICSDDEGMV